jgi:nucleoside 2-deoxyribosyltransferase
MFAFVLMPFDHRFDDIYKLGIKDIAEKLGITAERVDEQIFHKENILDRIYSQINIADFIIADMTGRNPNVFYEIGFAHAKGKICLLLTSNADDIPFDLKHHRHVIYGNSIQNLRQSLEIELVAIKSEVANRQAIITVELNKTDGILDKTSDWVATGKIDLFFDLHNRTNTPSPELESIYFYTGKGWKFSQDGQECLSTTSDEADYVDRHFVKPPVRRLHAGAWAQVKISGEKHLAFASKTEKLKDKYRVSGRSLVRIATSDGVFDYPINLDIQVEEFPF